MKIALCFSQYGPYHHARARALRELVGPEKFLAVQIAAGSRTYAWKQSNTGNVDLVSLCDGEEEDAGFIEVFVAALRLWKRENVTVALLPSYSPATSLALLLAAKIAGLKCVMMNESHAGTERAKSWKRWIKKRLVSLFDTALVGGAPQKRHFTTLGMDPEKIFTGYDAIDNAFFAREAARVREDADAWRARLRLPPRYILSLGRMVEKKNLGTLITAYAALRQRLGDATPALVLVGSGDQEPALRQQCADLGLAIADLTENGGRKTEFGVRSSEFGVQGAEDESPHTNQGPKTAAQPQNQEPRTKDQGRGEAADQGPRTKDQGRGEAAIFFAGFRQIEENPAFYALAECFVLPSLWEEWGLVVNEAMACGLPVVVSKTVGSAEDLVQPGKNGFHIDPTRPEDLTEALTTLATDPALRQRMGEASQEIITHWGCDHFAKGALAAVNCG